MEIKGIYSIEHLLVLQKEGEQVGVQISQRSQILGTKQNAAFLCADCSYKLKQPVKRLASMKTAT